MIDLIPVNQDTSVLTDEDIQPLKEVTFTTVRGKEPATYKMKQDLYTANDGEVMRYFERLTRRKKEGILKELGLGEGGWTNANRLRLRLKLVKKYYKKKESDKIIVDEEFEPLVDIGFILKGRKEEAQDLYHATDEQFMHFMRRATKTLNDRILKGIDFSNGWTDENRYKIRLKIIKRFKRSLDTVRKKTVDNKENIRL